MVDAPKVEFALGSEVSLEHFFKSSFARSFVTNCRDSKSLDYELLDNTIAEEPESYGNAGNNNFFSLVNFGNVTTALDNRVSGKGNSNPWQKIEAVQSTADVNELEKLRKQCQSLIEENRRLQDALTLNRTPHTRMIDNVVMQTQIETLQWQLKQTEANSQMYRCLMEQVVRFLDRARKSLDILHEKSTLKDKGSSARVPRSRSVHTVHGDSSPHRGVSMSTSSSSSDSSRFTRAKSVTQISPCTTGYREFTWSVLRRNDPVHCTPPRNKSQDLNKTHEGVVYKRPKQLELDPNEIPPEKLSQEAFRLMRTVQSLLAMREPDLARIASVDNSESSPSPVDHLRHNNNHHNEVSLPLQNSSFVNSTTLQEAVSYTRRRSCDRGNETRVTDSDSRMCFIKSSSHVVEADRSLQNLLPGVRRSIDATSLNSGSSKTTEEEDCLQIINPLNGSLPEHDGTFMFTPTSTPNKCTRKVEKRKERYSKSKPAASVSSVEDESGFSSMSSFQEIGLPSALPISPIRGCHTEIGLPEVPLEKARHRRWSSTPIEIKALLKQHRSSFTSSQTTAESLSVWV
ncbi:PREDICTED: uncharacterized protein LOC107194019 [Dufourea novaeangliae]|uniref:Uncharacterized protein n=1 Tax=Dufourea novaeangliae TaxID=178035 RepID=A0A154P3G1_DUFNO|nr:PREDICTED: uncharacterized protein LOC107194019 [Dufourea novaeangliae]KZC05670.1 hypothetical protein WN55_04610 [Dufourea novaeangliae]